MATIQQLNGGAGKLVFRGDRQKAAEKTKKAPSAHKKRMT